MGCYEPGGYRTSLHAPRHGSDHLIDTLQTLLSAGVADDNPGYVRAEWQVYCLLGCILCAAYFIK